MHLSFFFLLSKKAIECGKNTQLDYILDKCSSPHLLDRSIQGCTPKKKSGGEGEWILLLCKRLSSWMRHSSSFTSHDHWSKRRFQADRLKRYAYFHLSFSYFFSLPLTYYHFFLRIHLRKKLPVLLRYIYICNIVYWCEDTGSGEKKKNGRKLKLCCVLNVFLHCVPAVYFLAKRV